MSEAYQFAIGRSRALVLAGCFLAAAALLFLAGAITGTLYSGSHQASTHAAVAPVIQQPQKPAVKAPELPTEASTTPTSSAPAAAVAPTSSPATNAAAAQSTVIAPPPPASAVAAPSTAAAAPANSNSSAAAPSAGSSANPATSATAAAKPASAPATASAETKPQAAAKAAPAPEPVETSYALPLAVRVGSFSVKSNADTLVQSLKDMGYQPVMSRSTDVQGRTWYVVKLGPYTKWNAASRVATRISIAENLTPVIGPMR